MQSPLESADHQPHTAVATYAWRVLLRERLTRPIDPRFSWYVHRHPVRGSLLGGLVWGTSMTLFLLAATTFDDPTSTIRVIALVTIPFTAVVLVSNMWTERRHRSATAIDGTGTLPTGAADS